MGGERKQVDEMAEGDLVGVAAAIRTKRLAAGLSARQLSSIAGLSPSYVGKVEAGEVEPSLRAFAKIASALNMTHYEVWFCVSVEASR